MNQYLKAMRNGFNFHDRASRKEYWLFLLITYVVSVITLVLDMEFDFADGEALVLTGILCLVHIIPALAVSVRRLHDVDKSGWWLLIGFTGIGAIILLVFFCLGSTKGQNHYGPAPDGTGHDTGHNSPNNANQALGQPEGPHSRPTQPQAVQGAQPDPLAQLEKLKVLHDSGTLDDAEFAQMKTYLLSKAE
ncbi:DUF805 domain-containing protein [Sulfitobacter geojensis]|uniref:DUF805 domain-containing protein n=1 Tax=Sulfitobacter geojensis TaxID=1342299 RepID=UPI003B8C4E32